MKALKARYHVDTLYPKYRKFQILRKGREPLKTPFVRADRFLCYAYLEMWLHEIVSVEL
jgi:hypothetical protein